MSGKKIAIIVASILIVLAFLGALFVGGIVAVVFYSLGNSDAATTAKDFLRDNNRLERDIGDVRDFGWIVTGNVRTNDGVGQANLNLKAIGERRSVNTSVVLSSQSGSAWRIVRASYVNEAGQTIELPVVERRISPEQIFGPSSGERGVNRL